MNATTVTAFLAVFVSLLASVVVPVYVLRRKEKAASHRDAIAEAARLAAGTEVSWEAINRALAKDRDDLRHEMKASAASHAQEILVLRERMLEDAAIAQRIAQEEALRNKLRTDTEIERITARLEYCQSEVNRLYRELYGANRPASPND